MATSDPGQKNDPEMTPCFSAVFHMGSPSHHLGLNDSSLPNLKTALKE